MATLTARRDDARRNRETILRVADGAFADGSDAVPLDEIARRAGLGRATVYRHFPDRHALAVAVAAQNLEALREVVRADGDDRCPFRDILGMVFSTQASMRPLVALMLELPVREQLQYTEALIEALTPPFRQAQADGELRPDAEPADLALVMAMINTAVDAVPVGLDHGAALRRIVTTILDGLFGPSTPVDDQDRADGPEEPAAAGSRCRTRRFV
ncbi:TetR/AcrR family transcriptional regulator [Pseudofrankia inefficax]|uniref:Regulatory protein TetR n=1 Tax=Pseudofrankia inefficax (strain DSM 45817 / CECT 9037 / DDB 130130 / EuI1c) TaxID=298654 RepID=E3JBA7_PSEI1|nr:TetR/AcrR family transcriptional regulator [Pseudofrankia inefficax]ADP78637.1 regulatory protein TetR [Pseudofrankia inefficax]